MSSDRRITTRAIITDILSGMGDVPVMEKYGLSPVQFQEILAAIDSARAEGQPETQVRVKSPQAKSSPSQMRAKPRNYFMFNAKIYDNNDPGIHGVVNDITEKGLQVSGIHTRVAENRTFLILGSDVLTVDKPVVFDVVCRWVRVDDPQGETVAGFEITNIPQAGLKTLKDLIGRLTVAEKF